MKRWYSKRGARRGLLTAALATALWTSWAIGYIHGSRSSTLPAAVTAAPPKADTPSPRRLEL